MMKIKNSLYDRRKFLLNSAIIAGSTFTLPFSALISPLAIAQAPQLKVQRLTGKTLLVQGPSSNVLAVESDEGIIMVDGGHASWFEALHQALAEAFPNSPVRALFNTHWHREQTGSNEALGEQGVEIIAHENTRLWLGTEVWQRWSDITFPPLPQAALPKTVFLDSNSMEIANHNIRIDYLRDAHTDGDISVFFEEANVLVCGGLVSNGQWPVIDWWTGGYIGAMLDSFVTLLSVANQDTKIVPAFGDAMTVAELKAQNQMYLTIFDRLHGLLIRSSSLEDVLAAKPTAEYDAVMGDPTQFLTLAFKSFQGHLRDPQNFRILNIP